MTDAALEALDLDLFTGLPDCPSDCTDQALVAYARRLEIALRDAGHERNQLQRLFKEVANSTAVQLADANTKLEAQLDKCKTARDEALFDLSRVEAERDALKAAVAVAENACALHEDVAKSLANKLNERDSQIETLTKERDGAQEQFTQEREDWHESDDRCVTLGKQIETLRAALTFIGNQSCTMDAEHASESTPCTETGACVTEYCLPCYARTQSALADAEDSE